MKLFNLNKADIYVLSWIIYLLQDILYPSGIINQFLQLSMMVWAIFILVKIYSSGFYGSRILKATHTLVLMYIVYGLLFMLFKPEYPGNKIYYIQSSLNSLLPIFVFFYYSIKKEITEDRIAKYLFLFLGLYVLQFVDNYNNLLLEAIDSGSKNEDFTNNMAYNFVCLFAFVSFVKKKYLVQFVLALVIMYLIVSGMKRGAILIGLSCFLIFMYYTLRDVEVKKYRSYILLLTIAIVIIGIYYVNNLYQENEYFAERILETKEHNSSGRDRIYMAIINVINESSLFEFFLGHGANSTLILTGKFAHQDWLETMCNNGIIGVIILLSFFIRFTQGTISVRKWLPAYYYPSSLMALITCFGMTMFSMSIQVLQPSQTLIIGFITANIICHENLYYRS